MQKQKVKMIDMRADEYFACWKAQFIKQLMEHWEKETDPISFEDYCILVYATSPRSINYRVH